MDTNSVILDFNKNINVILDNVFKNDEELDEIEYIEYYSMIYSVINLSNDEISKAIEIFKNNVNNYLNVELNNILNSLHKIKLKEYFEKYNYLVEKSDVCEKIFSCILHYIFNNENYLSELLNEKWNKIIFKSYNDEIKKHFLENLKSEKHSLSTQIYYHVYDLNKNYILSYIEIFDKFNEESLQKSDLYESINLCEKIILNFNDDYVFNKVIKIIENLISNNKEYILNILREITIDLDKINEELEKKLIFILKIIFKYINELNLVSLQSYLNVIILYYIQNNIDILKSQNIISIFKIIKDIKDYFKYLSTFDFLESIINIVNISKNIEKYLQNIKKEEKMKYDKKFSLAIVKYINKKILLNQINDLYNINIVINLLDNIDHFIILYKSSLTKRLLNKNELDINNEKYVAKILCLNNNLIDISRINKMLEDYSKSIIFTRQFNEIYSQNDYINIITYDIWSINENNIVINNKELKKIIESKEKLLKSYYNNIESSKNLKMVDELCTLEIDFNNINLICTYKQAEFLYYFNDNNEYYIENKIFDEDLIKTFLETKIVKRKNNMIFINNKFQYKSFILDLSKFQKKRKNVLKKWIQKKKIN